MKKLGKKQHESLNTIEAFMCSCYCSSCSGGCQYSGYSYTDINNWNVYGNVQDIMN